jgi:quinol monooxygenase YgiN
MVRISVKDQAAWKQGFEQASPLRKKFGSLGVRAFAKSDSPNEIVILGEYKDLDQARQRFQSDEFRAATQKAGVNAPPEVTFMSELLKLEA